MKAYDILKALTDLEDEDVLDAQLPSEKKPHRLRRALRYLTAACLSLVLVMTGWMVTEAMTQDTTMRWTVRYREQCVTYLCKAQAKRWDQVPLYAPTVIPEGYVLDRTMEMTENRERTLVYRSTANPRSYMSFSHQQITGQFTKRLYNLPLGSYERYDVTIGDLPGQLYLYTDMRTGGQLIWLDKENCMFFSVGFDEDRPDKALALANSVQLEEHKEEES